MVTKLRASLVIVGALCTISKGLTASCDHNKGRSITADHHWDYLKFTQEWAPAKCMNVSSPACHNLGKIVSSWVIHGLWPTKYHTEDPDCCNDTDTFNKKNVQSIMSMLQKFWPDLLSTDPFSLWKHEWQKHGTCGVSLPALGNQLKYFSKTLDLNRQYDLQSILRNAGIEPRQKGYKVSAVKKAFSKYGSSKIQCIYDREQKKQFLVQMYLCLDKTFNTIDCQKVDSDLPIKPDRKFDAKAKVGTIMEPRPEPCRDNELVYYPPIPKSMYDHDEVKKFSSFDIL